MNGFEAFATAMAVLSGLWSAPLELAQAQTPATGASERLVVPFSDPSRPGTVRVRMVQGSVSIKAGASRDVVVTATGAQLQRPSRERERARTDGLRRLDQPFGFGVQEDANVVTISTRPQDEGQVTIEVPARTNLQVSLVSGGGVTIEGVEGEIEANNVNGPVTLTNVSGSIVAHSVNGDVTATMRQVGASPLAFTSLNGDVDVTLPPPTKANLRLRTDQGDIFTDFDVQTTAAPPSSAFPQTPGDADRKDRGRETRGKDALKELKSGFRLNRGVFGTINGGGIDIELRTFNGDVLLRRTK